MVLDLQGSTPQQVIRELAAALLAAALPAGVDVAGDATVRERLRQASSPPEVLEILAQASSHTPDAPH